LKKKAGRFILVSVTMKKILVVLLIFAAAGSVFPQRFRFGADVESGLGVFFPDPERQRRPGGYTGSGDPFVRLVSRDSGAAGWRAEIRGAYTGEAKDLGVNFALRAQDSENVSFHYGYGWFSVFDDTVKILGGKIDDDTFAAGDLIFAEDSGESYGLLAILRPFNLLWIGFGVYADLHSASSLLGPLDNGKYTASLALNIPDAFRITASYRNANAAGQASGAFITDNPAGSLQDSQAYLGIDMTAFKAIGLMFSAAGVVNNLQDRDRGIFRIFESLSYRGIKNLGLNLGLWQAGARYKLTAGGGGDGTGKEKDSDLSLRVWFQASYDLLKGKVVPRLDLNYLHAGYIDDIYRLHFDDGYAPNFDAEASLFTIRPSVAFKVVSNARLELGYYFIRFIGNRERVRTRLVEQPNAGGYGDTHIAYACMKISF
jgi:hypothetical protein